MFRNKSLPFLSYTLLTQFKYYHRADPLTVPLVGQARRKREKSPYVAQYYRFLDGKYSTDV